MVISAENLLILPNLFPAITRQHSFEFCEEFRVDVKSKAGQPHWDSLILEKALSQLSWIIPSSRDYTRVCVYSILYNIVYCIVRYYMIFVHICNCNVDKVVIKLNLHVTNIN